MPILSIYTGFIIGEKIVNSKSLRIFKKNDIKWIGVEIIFFLALFLYVWLRINPVLYNQRQDPVFLLEYRFFEGFLGYPGGLADYVAAFLAQFFYYPLVGALVITVITWGVSRVTAMQIKLLRPVYKVHFIHYFPAILLLIFHSHYKHPLAVSVSLFVTLLFVLLYMWIGRSVYLRIFFYLGLGLVLYYGAGGPFLIFALLCAVYEGLYLKRPVLSLVYILVACAIPYLAEQYFFPINTQMAYLYLLPFQESYRPPFTLYLWILFYLILYIINYPFFAERLAFLDRLKLRTTWLHFGFQSILLFMVAGFGAIYSFEQENHLLLQVDYYARWGKWAELLRYVQRHPSPLIPVNFQTNRALYHTGQLLENMFSFPQVNATAGLILPRKFSESAPLQESDFCYDFGSINEARHWAYEALGTDGETSWILKRLITVNFVCGDLRAAERCLNVLDKTLFGNSWSRDFRKILENPSLAVNDETVNHGLSRLVQHDFVVSNDHPTSELDSLLKVNPKNKMVFEYRIARELLACRLAGLLKHLELFNNFGYRHIPRHVEEAIIGMVVLSKQHEIPPLFHYIRPQTLQRYQEFTQVLEKYGGNKKTAQPELWQRFGNTYWYYMFYYNPVARMISSQASSRMGGIE